MSSSTPRPIRLKVASPCKVPWDSMKGDDAIRFCGTCERQVYNLSAMTSAQTEALLADPAGRPCVRFFQRADGTVMSADCPVGVRRVRRQRIAVGVGAGLMSMSALGYAGLSRAAADAHLAPTVTSPAPPSVATPAPVEPPHPPVETMGEPMAQPPPDEPPPAELVGKIAPPDDDELLELQGDVAIIE